MAFYIYDFGDKFDGMKWDFNEDNIPIYIIGKYPYKAFSYKNAVKLAKIRNKINILCENIINNKKFWEKTTNNKEFIEGVNIFIQIHKEFYYEPSCLPHPFYDISKKYEKTSRFLLSEIPKGTVFAGLSKPKMRYIEYNAPNVGKDGNKRALYRDIFLDLDKDENSLKSLIIHELAHTMANHVQYRDDDHNYDFKWAEKLIKTYWPKGKLFE